MNRKPSWLHIPIQGSKPFQEIKKILERQELNTVCLEANCPNRMECYEKRTATFLILGKYCTRNCRFCNVSFQRPEPLDPEEPKRIAQAVEEMGLKYVVITSVDRDDLPDCGAGQYAEVTRLLKKGGRTVELLVPDFKGRMDLLDLVLDEGPDVLNHNVEMIPRLYDQLMPQCDFERSLAVLKHAKERGFVTKTGIMLGFGETEEELLELFEKLRQVDVDMLTIGQYLQPTKEHAPVVEYVPPRQFDHLKEKALEMGFRHVFSGPFVRSSYHASQENILKEEEE